MRILKIKTFICVQLFLTLIKLGMRIIGEKDNYNTGLLFQFVWAQTTKNLPHAVKTMYKVAMYRIKYPSPNGPMPVPIGKFGRNPLQKTCLRSLYPKCEASVWYPPVKKGHYTP